MRAPCMVTASLAPYTRRMGVRSKRPATYEDLKLVPDHQVGEILAGELVVSPRPAIPHAGAASSIGADVNGAR